MWGLLIDLARVRKIICALVHMVCGTVLPVSWSKGFMVKGFAFSNPMLLVDVLLALVQALFRAWVSRKFPCRAAGGRLVCRLVITVQLMWPVIGRNASCAVVDFTQLLGLPYFNLGRCGLMIVYAYTRIIMVYEFIKTSTAYR